MSYMLNSYSALQANMTKDTVDLNLNKCSAFLVYNS